MKRMAQEQLYSRDRLREFRADEVDAVFSSIGGGRQPVAGTRATLNQLLLRVDVLRGELRDLGGAAEESDEEKIGKIVEKAKEFYETIMGAFFSTRGFYTVDVESWPAATTGVEPKKHFWCVARNLATTKRRLVLADVLEEYKPGVGAVVPVPRWFGKFGRGEATCAPMGLVIFERGGAFVGRMFNLFYETTVLKRKNGTVNGDRATTGCVSYFVFSLAKPRRLIGDYGGSSASFRLLFRGGGDATNTDFMKEFT